MMGESYELEEGEMNCSIDDLDVDLSYIDKKVQNVLGHLQKDVVAGSLKLFGDSGPTIYDYGSFLPTYKRLPVVPSYQRSSLGNHTIQGFSNSLTGKNVVQKIQSLPTISCKLVSSQDPQNNQSSRSLLAQAPEKVPVKKGNAKTPGIDMSGHKPITVRIKMGSEILSRKVTMVSNDLGLDDSLNLPPQNSHEDSSGILPHTSLEKICESPYRIIQEMTAIPVPEDLLLSPLPDSLLLVKKRYTLLGNETVLKAGKELPIQTHNKFSDVLGCEETPSGRRRKAVDCFDATTRNVTSSIGEIKKQKVFSTGDLARENSTWGLGGACSTNDGLTAKNNLKKGIRKDGERGPIVSFAKSNKMTVARKQTEKESKTSSPKLKQNSSKNHYGDKIVTKMSFSDAAYIGQNSMDIVPSSNSLDLDNWAQCESCEEWRLLPSGLKPEQLPKKWLCSMQTWLPGLNHCGISLEETVNAVRFCHGSEARGPESGVKSLSDARNADKSYQPLTSGALPNPTEENSIVKDLSQGVSSNILVDAAKPMRSKSHVFKIKNMKLPVETPNGTRISKDLGLGSQIKIKKKKEGDDQESERSKQSKTGDGDKLFRDMKTKEIHFKQDLDWTPAERKSKRHDNDLYTSDVERDTKKRLLSTKKKPDNQPQLTTDSGSLCTKAHDRISSPVRKIRLVGYQQGNNVNNSKFSADGAEKEPSLVKAIAIKTSVQELKTHQRNELFQADGYRECRNVDASCRYFSCGSGQISGVETSSSSKVLGSHKSGRRYVEKVKASPVESVSSSPARSSCLKNLALAGEGMSWQNQNLKFGDDGSRTVNNRKPLCLEADCEFSLTTHPRNKNQPNPELCKQNSRFGDLPYTSMKTVFGNRSEIKNISAITHETMDRSAQAVNDTLQKAEKLMELADCLKRSGFDHKYKKANFKAALKFLRGASLLEMCSSEKVEGGKMSHVEAYRTAAKLSESCARQYEANQEMATAALSYKCMEVACMRVVYGRSLGLSGEWSELQKIVQMTPQAGESPSSSASDVDIFNHQGLVDKSSKTKRVLTHVAGNHHPATRNQHNLLPLLDFTENMNLAMEASAKSRNALRAAAVTLEETHHGDCVSAIKKVVDFSFHDVEALIQMIKIAMDVLSSSSFRAPKC